MFRNQYDGDNTTWSPQGRLFQVEYAMEAVKQGSACVGLKSKTHVVLAGNMKSDDELAAYQQKIFKIDDHIGMVMAGLTADARVLCKYMRNECLNHKFVYDSPIQMNRLVVQVADKNQIHTQRYGRRPYGVGLLLGGFDQTGPHLFETSPSGNYFDFHAQAIGARSQSAKTYLEKTFQTYADAKKEELIKHSLLALRETCGSQSEGLTVKSTVVAVVSEHEAFHILDDETLKGYLDSLDDENAAPMETS